MKAVLLQENLQQALGNLQKAIPSRPQLPILSAILLTATTEGITVSATDLYFGVRSKVAALVETEGTVAVPGKEFREVIGSLPAGELKLEFEGTTLKISSKHTKAKLQCLDATEYPEFPESAGDKLVLSQEIVEQVTKYAVFSTSSDVARPILTGVLFSLLPTGTEVVATDGFRLSVLSTALVSETPQAVILPAKTLLEVSRIMQQLAAPEAVFAVSQSLKQLHISFPGVEVFSRLLDGEFPPYQKIMPSSFTTEMVLPAAELLEQVKRALIFSRDTSSIVQLEVTSESCTVTSASASLGDFRGELPSAQIQGPGGSIAFKTKYLPDYLQTVKDGEIWFGMTDSLKPALFTSPEAPGLKYIVMPFRVSS